MFPPVVELAGEMRRTGPIVYRPVSVFGSVCVR